MPQYTDDTCIYLLMSEKVKQARGFQDRNRALTFAFTTRKKANAFLKKAREVGMLTDVDLLFQMTVGEYFEWKAQGKASADLAIDPQEDMLQHPVFASHHFSSN